MKNVSKSAVCKTCHKRLNKQEMVFYIDGYYCPKCYQERISRETFSRYVCELFNLKAPGPRIWKQRKRLREKYGYDDETIILTLDYLFFVEKRKFIEETIGLVAPWSVERARKWSEETKRDTWLLEVAKRKSDAVLKKEKVSVQDVVNGKKAPINLDDLFAEEGSD